MKDSVKKVPIIGPSCERFGFVFMSRNLDKDRPILLRSAELANEEAAKGQPSIFVMYPEGTRFSMKKRDEARAFAKSRGMHEPNYTLVPRTRGFELCVAEMHGAVEDVYDGTIAFTGFEFDDVMSCGPLKFIFGGVTYGTKLVLHLRRVPVSEVTKDAKTSDERAANAREWLLDAWKRKDATIERLVQEGLEAKKTA